MEITRQAIKPRKMKSNNRKLVLDLIRIHSYSRVSIARLTQLSRAAITVIVDDLISQGLVSEGNGISTASGRHPLPLYINYHARIVLSVCITRCAVRVGIAYLDGAVLCENNQPSASTPEETVAFTARQFAQWKTQYALRDEQILGIGIIAPGPLQYQNGVMRNVIGLPQWNHVPIVQLFSEAIGLPTVLERDTNALALEEKYFGVARDINNFMVLQVDVGVGASVMVQDRIFRGASGFGCELGHISIRFDGPACKCGNYGCLEEYVSIPRLLANTPFTSWKQAVDAAEDARDAAALRLIDNPSQYLSCAIITAFNLFDLDNLLICGDLAYRADRLTTLLNKAAGQNMITRLQTDSQIIRCSNITYSIRTGAMPIIHAMFSDDR